LAGIVAAATGGARMKRSPLFVVLFTVFVDLVGFGIVLPILPYYAERFGATSLEIGAIISSFSLAQFIFAPIWGRISDRVGRRPVILVSLFGSLASYLLFARAQTLWMLLLSRALAGVAAANIAAAQAYVADVTPPEERARGMGLIGAAFGFGFTVGPFLASKVAPLSAAAPGYLAAGLALVNLVLASFFLPESLRPESRALPRRGLSRRALGRVFASPVLTAVSMTFIAISFTGSAFTSMMPLFLARRLTMAPAEAANIFALVGATMAIMQWLAVHPLSRRFGERTLAILGVTGMAATLCLLPSSAAIGSLVLLLLLYAVSAAVVGPSAMSLVTFVADARQQGEVIGVVQSLASLSRVVGPVWGGLVMGHFGVGAPFYSSSIVCALASVYIWRHLRETPGVGGRG
jgi:DHA1 family tetracycline resistance protein-like MFS transporter